VVFVEEVRPEWSVDADGLKCPYADSQNRRVFRDVMQRFGLLDCCCQLYSAGEATTGLSRNALREVAGNTDLLIDISGHVTTDFVLDAVRRRAYLDQDPVYTQLWRAEYGKGLSFDRYDVFFTVGLNIGTPFSHIPDCGIDWKPTLPPVVLDLWNVNDVPIGGEPFTTVASWGGYADLCYRGEWYRSKYDEFRRFSALPRRSAQAFEVLLKDFRDDDEGVGMLRDGGWHVRRSEVTSDLLAYRDYIAASRAEIGISKGAYVKGRSGWFSDRTAAYLASARPALAQSTGFERILPAGKGLIPFDTLDAAVAAVQRVNADYPGQCKAARALAEQFFDYRKVLPSMIEICMAA
jgi:hypothetical protein